ncbi:hypothetical protein Q3G72_019403 [Acer saccharum]|nr:hypothetical protein Q3G72_019403 [Acer saccharum]
MATPHIVGIGALIKQYNPSWTPSMIASAITTTTTKYDNYGDLIMAEGSDTSLYNGTHFDFGAGLVNATRAIDPGLDSMTTSISCALCPMSIPERSKQPPENGG